MTEQLVKISLWSQLRHWWSKTNRLKLLYIFAGFVIAASATAIGFMTGGVGVFAYILIGLAIAGLIQGLNDFYHQLKKMDGPKINRPIYVYDKLEELNGFTKLPKHFILNDTHPLLRKCYVAYHTGSLRGVYYINSMGHAHRVNVKETLWQELKSCSKGLNSPTPELDDIIKRNVGSSHVQRNRKIAKNLLVILGLILAIGGLVTALPILAIPIGIELGLLIVGTIALLAAPVIGSVISWRHHYTHQEKLENIKQETPIIQEPISVLNHEDQLNLREVIQEVPHIHSNHLFDESQATEPKKTLKEDEESDENEGFINK